jgi:hypothetical protein
MMRASFRADAHGWSFTIRDSSGRIIRQGRCAGRRSDAMAAADAEMVAINEAERAEMPATHDLGGSD